MPGKISFDVFEVDLRAGELSRHSRRVKLQEKPFQFLAALLERPGDLVTREELRQKLWPADTFVDFDRSVNIAVAKLRAALGDSADKPRFIETLPRRGYRFLVIPNGNGSDSGTHASEPLALPTVGVVRAAGSAPAAVPGPGVEAQRVPMITVSAERARTVASQKPWFAKRRAWVATVALLAVGVVAAFFILRGRSHSREAAQVAAGPVRIAVLPFVNLTGDGQEEYLCDGLTEAMISELSRLSPETLGVIARTSAMHYKGSNKSVPQIAKELRVDYVLESSVRDSGDRLRVTAQLVRGTDGSHVWAGEYERQLKDVLDVQQAVAIAIAGEIGLRLALASEDSLHRAHPVDPEAYREYLLGRFYWNKRSREGLLQSLTYFRRALDRDSAYARAYAGMADAYLVLGGGYLPDKEAYEQGRTATLKALELDNTLAEAYASLAYEKYIYERDWAAAEENYQKAISINPNYATAHQWYAIYLAAMRRSEEAIAEINRALELDPLSLPVNYSVGAVYLDAGRNEEALSATRKAMEIDPNNAVVHGTLGAIYQRKHLFEQAITEFRIAQQLSGTYSPYAVEVAHVSALAGKKEESREMVRRLLGDRRWGDVAPFEFAETYAALGEKERAFRWLRKSVDDLSCSAGDINVKPGLDPLRSDPRFVAILREYHLPPKTVSVVTRR